MSEGAYADNHIGYTINTGEVFSVDEQDVHQAFPGIARVIELVGNSNVYGTDEEIMQTLDEYGARPTRKQTRIAEQVVDENMTNVIHVLTNKILEENHEDPRVVTRKMIGHWFLNNPQAKAAIDLITIGVEDTVRASRDIQQISSGTLDAVLEIITNNPIAQYEMAKIFASDVMVDDRPSNGLTLLVMSRVSNATIDGKPLDEALRTSLAEGKFDEYIAHDILESRDTTDEDINNFVRKIVSLETFIAQASPELSAPEARYRVAENIDAWPYEMKMSLAKMRNELLRKLNRNIYGANQALGVLYPETTDTVDQAMQGFSDSIARFASKMNNGRAVSPMRRADVRTKRRRMQKSQEVTQEITPSTEQEIVILRPLELLTASGERFSRETPEFEGVISEYLSRYSGAQGLDTLIENTLEHLSRLDLSKGQFRGVKKFAEPIKRGTGQMDLYEFKPADVAGLSTGSKRGQAMRVFFSFDPESEAILIHEFFDRSQKEAVERKLRINYLNQSA